MTTLHQSNGKLTAYAKGAPEVILKDCDWQMTADGVQPLDECGGRNKFLAAARDMAGDALRVLAIASKPNATLESCPDWHDLSWDWQA